MCIPWIYCFECNYCSPRFSALHWCAAAKNNTIQCGGLLSWQADPWKYPHTRHTLIGRIRYDNANLLNGTTPDCTSLRHYSAVAVWRREDDPNFQFNSRSVRLLNYSDYIPFSALESITARAAWSKVPAQSGHDDVALSLRFLGPVEQKMLSGD